MTSLAPRAMKSAQDVCALARRLWGEVPDADGIVHVTAVWRGPDARLHTLAIDDQSPKSDYDAFALSFARASANAIVITGKVLRDEPSLSYSLDALGLPAAPLSAYRRDTGRAGPPELYVLTSGRGLDPLHPALHGWAHAQLVTPLDAQLPDVGRAGIQVESMAEPSLRALVERLRAEGARRVLVEAGPSTSRALYEGPLRVDELLLSIYEGPEPAHLALPLAPGAERLIGRAPPCRPEEGWSFELRRGTGTSDPMTSPEPTV